MLSHFTILVGIGAAFLVLRHFIGSWRRGNSLSHIPTHSFVDGNNSRKRYLTSLKTLLESGYRKYNKAGQPFKVKIPVGGYSVKYRVVLPKDHLEEIKHLSNNIFSWQLASRIIFAQDFTGAPDRGPWSGKALRVGIHQNLADMTAQLEQRINAHFLSTLPGTQGEVATVNLMEFFVPAITHVTNALLVDERLSSDPDWLRQTSQFAVNRYSAADDVRKWPPLLSKLVAPYIPSVRRLREQRAYVKEKMRPIYDELRQQDLLKTQDRKALRKGHFGYEWLWGGAPQQVTLDDFSDTMMRTLIASIHTTAKTISVALVDLLAQPQFVQELKAEAREAVVEGDEAVDLDKLVRLDCFLKESQRLSPVFLCRILHPSVSPPRQIKLRPKRCSHHEQDPDTGLRIQMLRPQTPAGHHDNRTRRRHRHGSRHVSGSQFFRRPQVPAHAGGTQRICQLAGTGHVNNRLARLRAR